MPPLIAVGFSRLVSGHKLHIVHAVPTPEIAVAGMIDVFALAVKTGAANNERRSVLDGDFRQDDFRLLRNNLADCSRPNVTTAKRFKDIRCSSALASILAAENDFVALAPNLEVGRSSALESFRTAQSAINNRRSLGRGFLNNVELRARHLFKMPDKFLGKFAAFVFFLGNHDDSLYRTIENSNTVGFRNRTAKNWTIRECRRQLQLAGLAKRFQLPFFPFRHFLDILGLGERGKKAILQRLGGPAFGRQDVIAGIIRERKRLFRLFEISQHPSV